MPSVFPGMDPYLENHLLWPDFHHHFATAIGELLNQSLPEPYFAQLEQRLEVGIVDDEDEDEEIARYIPDVSVNESFWSGGGGAAVIEQPRVVMSPAEEWDVEVKMHKHLFVEVREGSGSHRLVTLIEILSPSNKRGKDREAYTKKQREVIESDASLVEIDLLRTGRRIVPSIEIEQRLKRRKVPADYLVLIGRAWDRTPSRQHYQLFPFTLRDSLPCIPIPLREADEEAKNEPLLDLQYLFQRAYDAGPYRRGAVNYSQPPDPPLSDTEWTWAKELLAKRYPAILTG